MKLLESGREMKRLIAPIVIKKFDVYVNSDSIIPDGYVIFGDGSITEFHHTDTILPYYFPSYIPK